MSEYSADVNFKMIRAVVICRESGEYLIDQILDSNINPIMISSFVSALSMFGKENMGKIEEISVKGIEVEMTIVAKHGLILIALMDKDFYRDLIRQNGENILDLFYNIYKKDIENFNGEIKKFEEFRKVLFFEIQATLDKMKDLESKRELLKAGLEYKE
ncbi:MAG: hypothetical protein ACTSR8_01265 [Promethearchaeota archaeon]